MDKAYSPSLWDAEDDDSTVRVADLTVGQVSTKDAQEFIDRYHYSGGGGGMVWRYGLWSGMTLWGVVCYNWPTRETCASVFGEEHLEHVAHMSRLVCAEHSPRNSESRLIGGSLRLLAQDHPELWAVLTYADILQNHIGYVYQATNALYTGVGALGHARYVLPNGVIKGDYEGSYISQNEARARGWQVIQPLGKHRYLYIQGTRAQRKARRAMLQLPVLEYPK